MNDNFKNLNVIKDHTIKRWIDIKDYGAKGDGINDDTIAIEEALNTAKTNNIKRIYFPDGVYRISRGFKLGLDNNDNKLMDLVIEGNGWNSIIIVDYNLTTPIDAVFEITDTRVKRFELRNIAIFGNAINSNGNTTNNSSKFKMNYGFRYSGLNDSGQIRITNVRIQGALKYAVDLGKIEDSVLKNSQILENIRGIRVNTVAGSSTLERLTILQSHEYDIVIVDTKQIKITDIECSSTVRQAKANILISGLGCENVEIKSAWIENKKNATNEGYNIWISDTHPDDNSTGKMPNKFILMYSGFMISDNACVHIDQNTSKILYLYFPYVHVGRVKGQTSITKLVDIEGAGIHSDSMIIFGVIDQSDVNGAYLVYPNEAMARYKVRRLGRNTNIRVGKTTAEAEFGSWIPNTKTEGLEEALLFANTISAAEPNPDNKATVEILDGIYELDVGYKITSKLTKNSRVKVVGQGERRTIIRGYVNDYVIEFKSADTGITGKYEDWGYLEIKELTIHNKGNGIGTANGLHTFHLNSIKMDKVWIAGRNINLNSEQLQLSTNEVDVDSVGLFLEGRAAEQITVTDTLVSGVDIAYEINVDHLVMINPQARKIGNTVFKFRDCFDVLILNPHGFQIGRRDISTSGMFYFTMNGVTNITAVNPHLEDHDPTWQTAIAPFINVGSNPNINFRVVKGYISVYGASECIVFKQNNINVYPLWFQGIKIDNLLIDNSAMPIYLYCPNDITNAIENNDMKALTMDCMNRYGKTKVEHYIVGDIRQNVFASDLVYIWNDPTSTTIADTETSISTQIIERSFYPHWRIRSVLEIDISEIATATDLTINIKDGTTMLASRTITLPEAKGVYEYVLEADFDNKHIDSQFTITFTAQKSTPLGIVNARLINAEVFGVRGT